MIQVPNDTFMRQMEIGDLVTFRGRAYVLRGLDPMSVDLRRAHLEDAVTSERMWVDLLELEEQPPQEP